MSGGRPPCVECGTHSTPLWRGTRCNACAIRRKRHKLGDGKIQTERLPSKASKSKGSMSGSLCRELLQLYKHYRNVPVAPIGSQVSLQQPQPQQSPNTGASIDERLAVKILAGLHLATQSRIA